jgi:hypothetical protein
VPEQLAGLQAIEHAPVEDQLDGPAAHDPEVANRLGALGEDRRASGMVLQLGHGGDALELCFVQRVERGVGP